MSGNNDPTADEKTTVESVSRTLPPAARRALAEAEQRRAERDSTAAERPHERGGREGPDPVRYGDWEKNGIISDF